MSWLESTIDESEAASQIQRLTFTDELPKPGFWKGSIDTIGPGLKRGAYEGAAAIESGFTSLFESGLDLAAGALLPEPRGGGTPDVTSAERSSQQTLGKGMADVEHELRPDPASVGVAGQIINEVSAIIPRTIAGTVVAGPVGGAVAAGAPAGYAGKQSGMYNDGLDESTATLKGVIEGTTTGVGALLPAAKFVKPLLGDATIAVGANVGLGVAQRGATAELLEGGGYHAQAAQYRAMDGTALATDAILGAAFFGVGRAGMPRVTSEQVNAALTERNAQHFDVETAPGIPTTPRAAAAHQEAMTIASDQLARGEAVAVPESLIGAELLPKPPSTESPVAAAVRATLDPKHGTPDQILAAMPRSKSLSEANQAVEGKLAEEIANDYPGTVERYSALPDAEGGKVLNTDTARELSSDYSASKDSRSLLSAAVHEPASFFIKKLYAEKLADMPPDSTVMFTSGGAGAGKSSAINDSVSDARAAKDRAHVVFDTNMNGTPKARQKIEQALAAGGKVEIWHVQRDPVDALVNGALPRARKRGRTVPLKSHVETHVGSAETIVELADIYKDDPRVSVRVIDNSRGLGKAMESDVEFVKSFDYHNLHERLRSALDEVFSADRISREIYEGTLGSKAVEGPDTGGVRPVRVPAGLPEGNGVGNRPAAGSGQGNGRPTVRPGSREGSAETAGSGSEALLGSEPAREGGHDGSLGLPRSTDSNAGTELSHKGEAATASPSIDSDPVFQLADEIMSRTDDIHLPTGAMDADGNPVTISARQLMAEADADIARAQQESEGFAAAAACYLQRGE